MKNKMDKYEVQTKFIYGFENVWRDENGNLEYFESYQDAKKEIKELVDDWNKTCKKGYEYSYEDYRVVKIKQKGGK
jgi:hypothetical protein